MESLYLLIPLGIVVVAAAIAMFLWAANSGQFENLEEQGRRALDDEDAPIAPAPPPAGANRQPPR
jgi:cbb3-type cytochrome oxidase maturation protein